MKSLKVDKSGRNDNNTCAINVTCNKGYGNVFYEITKYSVSLLAWYVLK